MNVTIYWESIDITDEVIEYRRTEALCDSSGEATISIKGNSTRNLELYDSIVIYEEGIKKATLKITAIDHSMPEYNKVIHASNTQKNLFDTFISDTYNIEEYLTYKTRYWIDKFLDESDVTHSFETASDGEYLPSDLIIGGSSAGDIVNQLLQYSGWYLRYDANGNAVIGNIDFNSESYSATITDSTILSLNIIKDDSILRNRAVVWGMGIPETGHWVHADITIPSPYVRGTNDTRPVLISNHMIQDTVVANQIANKALNEFSHIKNEKRIKVAGAINIHLGQNIYVNSEYFRGVCLVTSIDVIMAQDGFITDLVLDQRCPRLVGYLNYTGGYVYAGTTGAGVWRKDISLHTWEDFSSGITDLNIIDLDVNNGVYSCVASGGYLYSRYIGDTAWSKLNPVGFVDLSGISYSPYDISCVACTINRETNTILAAYNLNNTVEEVTNGYYAVTDSGRSWIVSLYPNSTYSTKQVTWSGEQNITVLDIENAYDSTIVACLASPEGNYGEGLGVKHHQLWYDRPDTLFTSVENMYVYSGYVANRTLDRGLFSDYADYRVFPGIYGEYVFGRLENTVEGHDCTKYVFRYNYVTDVYDYIDVESFILARCNTPTDPPFGDHPNRVVTYVAVLSETQVLFSLVDYGYYRITIGEYGYYTGSKSTQYVCRADFSSLTFSEIASDYVDTTGSFEYIDENNVSCILFLDDCVGVSKTNTNTYFVTSWLMDYTYEGNNNYKLSFTVYDYYQNSFSNFIYGPMGNNDSFTYNSVFLDMGEGYLCTYLQSSTMFYDYDLVGLDTWELENYSYICVLNCNNKTITYDSLPCLVHVYSDIEAGDYFYTADGILNYYMVDSKAANFIAGYVYLPINKYTIVFNPGPSSYISPSYIKVSRNGNFEIFDIGSSPDFIYGRSTKIFGRNNLCVLFYIRYADGTYQEVLYDLDREVEIYSRVMGTTIPSWIPWMYFAVDEYTPRILALSLTSNSSPYHVYGYVHTITLDYDENTNSYSTIVTEDIPIPDDVHKPSYYSTRLELYGETITFQDAHDWNSPNTYFIYVSNLVLTDPPSSIGLNPVFTYKNNVFDYQFEAGSTDIKLDASKGSPLVIFGGNAHYNSGFLGMALQPQELSESYRYVNLITSTLSGCNFVSDSRNYGELNSTGMHYNHTGFLSNTVNAEGYSALRTIDWSWSFVYNDYVFTTETTNYTFSGLATCLETTNNQDNPYIFISTNGTPPKFYQRNTFTAKETPQTFVDRSTGLPNNEITIIRADDTI